MWIKPFYKWISCVATWCYLVKNCALFLNLCSVRIRTFGSAHAYIHYLEIASRLPMGLRYEVPCYQLKSFFCSLTSMLGRSHSLYLWPHSILNVCRRQIVSYTNHMSKSFNVKTTFWHLLPLVLRCHQETVISLLVREGFGSSILAEFHRVKNCSNLILRPAWIWSN